jgi:hypothetical protein
MTDDFPDFIKSRHYGIRYAIEQQKASRQQLRMVQSGKYTGFHSESTGKQEAAICSENSSLSYATESGLGEIAQVKSRKKL